MNEKYNEPCYKEPCREIVTKERLYDRLNNAIKESELLIMREEVRLSVLKDTKRNLDEYFEDLCRREGKGMTKEEKLQEYMNKQLIDELSKMPPMVIATAYLYALNYALYSEDVTKKWVTATQQTAILQKAYNEGYNDALQKQAESEETE